MPKANLRKATPRVYRGESLFTNTSISISMGITAWLFSGLRRCTRYCLLPSCARPNQHGPLRKFANGDLVSVIGTGPLQSRRWSNEWGVLHLLDKLITIA